TAMLLAMALVLLDRSWRLTTMSLIGVAVQPLLILAIVPLMRRIGPGGAGAGAALGVTGSELLITTMFLYSVGRRALDRRSVLAVAKSILASVFAIIVDRALVRLGAWRLIPDMLVYLAVALAIGALRVSEVVRVARMVLSRRRG